MIYTDLFITRDSDGQLAGHFTMPERRKKLWASNPFASVLYMDINDIPCGYAYDLKDKIRNLKFEHEPIRVKVVLKIDDIEIKD